MLPGCSRAARSPKISPPKMKTGARIRRATKLLLLLGLLKPAGPPKEKMPERFVQILMGTLSSVRTRPTCAYAKHTRARACGRATTETIPRQTRQMPEAVQSKHGWRNVCCHGAGSRFFAALLIISIHWSKSVSGNMLMSTHSSRSV